MSVHQFALDQFFVSIAETFVWRGGSRKRKTNTANKMPGKPTIINAVRQPNCPKYPPSSAASPALMAMPIEYMLVTVARLIDGK